MSSYTISNTKLNSMRVFILQKSELEKRLVPNTYHTERRNIIKALRRSNNVLEPLKLVSTFNKNIVKEIPENYPYIGLENIESNTGSYIKTTEKESVSSAIVFKKGQVLFPKLRPYLNKVYFAEFDGVCSTEFHILDSQKVSNEYLANFLRTSIVVNQTKYLMSGNTLPRLQTEDIESLLIPILTKEKEEKVNSLMRVAFKQKKQNESEAERLLASIDDYLLKELGIDLPEPPENTLKNRMFTVSLKEVSGSRFDPKLYDKNTQAIGDAIKRTNLDKPKLKELVTHSVAGDWGKDEKENLVDNYKRCLVIRATEFDNLYNLNLDNSRVKYRLINTDKLARIDIQENDLLIEKSGGSPDQPVGRISILTNEILKTYQIGYSNFIHKIRIDNSIINSEYLFCFLKTVHNIKLTDAMQSQTNGIRNLIMSNYFNQIIPLPTLDKQKEIAEHISGIREQAQNLKDQTAELLKEASKEIEKILLN